MNCLHLTTWLFMMYLFLTPYLDLLLWLTLVYVSWNSAGPLFTSICRHLIHLQLTLVYVKGLFALEIYLYLVLHYSLLFVFTSSVCKLDSCVTKPDVLLISSLFSVTASLNLAEYICLRSIVSYSQSDVDKSFPCRPGFMLTPDCCEARTC